MIIAHEIPQDELGIRGSDHVLGPIQMVVRNGKDIGLHHTAVINIIDRSFLLSSFFFFGPPFICYFFRR
jgi:hypothetical protein